MWKDGTRAKKSFIKCFGRYRNFFLSYSDLTLSAI